MNQKDYNLKFLQKQLKSYDIHCIEGTPMWNY